MYGSKLNTINHEYDKERLALFSDGNRSKKGKNISTDWTLPTEGVTSLMISCQQELEHDVHTILLKKVRKILLSLAVVSEEFSI